MSLLKKIFTKVFSLTPFRVSLVVTLVFAAASIVADIDPDAVGLIAMINQKSLDLKFRFRGPIEPKANVIVLAVDEKSFSKFGQWPFDRAEVFAPVFEKLCALEPAAVGVDLVWSESEKIMSSQLSSSLKSLSSSGAISANALDQAIKDGSGDARLRTAFEKCGERLVLGWAPMHQLDGAPTKAVFDPRFKALSESPGTKLLKRSGMGIRFPEFKDDPSANVTFHSHVVSGLINNPVLQASNVSYGFFTNNPDSDGYYRSAMLVERVGEDFYPSLALKLAQKVFNNPEKPAMVEIFPSDIGKGKHELFNVAIPIVDNGQVTKFHLPANLSGEALVNYRGPNFTFANVSVANFFDAGEEIEYEIFDVKNPKAGVQVAKAKTKEFFKDSVVIMGVTATALYDIRPRPLDKLATGVENHANILDNIIGGDFLKRFELGAFFAILIGMVIFSLAYGQVIIRADAKWGAIFAFVVIQVLLGIDQKILFEKMGIMFSAHMQAAQLLFQYIAITILKFMQEESDKKFIRSAFDKFVSPAVINQMLNDPSKLRIGGEKKDLSILFSDIRGFTELSEKVDVKQLTQFLNEYLGSMTNILQGNSGTLDKYIGDAVMGFWGAPIDLQNHASLAVKTAVEMMKELPKLNAEFQKKYGMAIDIGIGINSGPVSVGNFGSSKVFEYTVIGDNVNLASRLEGINKYYGTHIIISESTYEQLKPGEFLTREVDTVKVKGKKKPVKIYEVFPDDAYHTALKSIVSEFKEGLEHYYHQDWEKAVDALEHALATRKDDRPSLELLERIKYYKDNPPGDEWDGSWEMTSK